MLIVFFLIWLILNNYFAFDMKFLQIVLFGLVISTIIYLFLIKLTKWTFKTDCFFIKNIHLFIAYAFVLIYNVIISNFKIFKLVLTYKDKPEPEIIKVHIDLDMELTRTILANSITLTPGTITISSTNGDYVVHCLKKEYFEGIENTAMVKILRRMEGKKNVTR